MPRNTAARNFTELLGIATHGNGPVVAQLSGAVAALTDATGTHSLQDAP